MLIIINYNQISDHRINPLDPKILSAIYIYLFYIYLLIY